MKNIGKNAFASGFVKIVNILNQLFLVPFFIKFWGVELYGEWLTLSAIPSFLTFADLGFGSSIANSFILSYSSGNTNDASSILKSGLLLLIGVIVFFILLILLLSHLFIVKILVLDFSFDTKIALYCLEMLMISRLIGFLNQVSEGILIARGKAHVAMYIIGCQSFLLLMFGLVVLWFGGEVLVYSIVNSALTVLFSIMFLIFSYRTINLSNDATYSLIHIKKMFLIGLGYLFNPIWQAVSLQGPILILNHVVGASSVTIYTTLRTLSKIPSQINSLYVKIILPELQLSYGKGNTSLFNRYCNLLLIGSVVISIISLCGLYLGGAKFYSIWTNNKIELNLYFWFLFLVCAFLNGFWWSASFIFTAKNKPFFVSFPAFIFTFVSMIFSYFMIEKWGVLGGIFGNLIFEFSMAIFISIMLKKTESFDYSFRSTIISFFQKRTWINQ